MKSFHLSALLGCLGLGAVLFGVAPAPAEEQPAPPDGAEVLARGPVHEAFAEPVDVQPAPTPIIRKQPPEPIAELPPDQKPEGDNVQWLPGYWAWDDDRSDYIWISGFWRVPPPGRVWVPGHWAQVEDGSQWTPGFWQLAEQQDVQYLPPPPAPVDAGPSTPAPQADSTYVPGCWVYRETRYFWRPGFWLGFRPGWVWTPAHYCWAPAGYVFVEGHWDYPLQQRGLLFAPVYFARPALALRADYYYTPSFVVQTDFLLGALFVRPHFGHYYFGDYFEPAYARSGFTPWIDVRVGRHSYDPLYSYYRHEHADNRNWDRDLRSLYVGRRSGEIARPPQTLVQQNTVIQNTTVNNTTVNNIKNVTVLRPLAKMDPKVVKLKPVNREERQHAQKVAQQFQAVTQQRRQMETQMVAKGTVPTKPTDPPRTMKFDQLKAVAPPRSATIGAKAPPPPPVPQAPKHEERALPRTEVPKAPVITPKPLTRDTTPLPKKETTPPLPPPKKETTPLPAPKKEATPPPPPAPKKEVTPAPAPKKEVAPAPPPPAPKREVTPPPAPKSVAPPAPPPPAPRSVAPPPPPPAPKSVAPPPPAPKSVAPPAPPPPAPKNATPPAALRGQAHVPVTAPTRKDAPVHAKG